MRFLILGLVLAACGDTALPTPTQTACPDPDPGLTWDNFGRQFMMTYCTHCHTSELRQAQLRNGAPLFHDYDTFEGVQRLPDHIDENAGSGPASHNTIMPPDRCPSTPGGPLARDCAKPSDEERKNLSLWLACEASRP